MLSEREAKLLLALMDHVDGNTDTRVEVDSLALNGMKSSLAVAVAGELDKRGLVVFIRGFGVPSQIRLTSAGLLMADEMQEKPKRPDNKLVSDASQNTGDAVFQTGGGPVSTNSRSALEPMLREAAESKARLHQQLRDFAQRAADQAKERERALLDQVNKEWDEKKVERQQREVLSMRLPSPVERQAPSAPIHIHNYNGPVNTGNGDMANYTNQGDGTQNVAGRDQHVSGRDLNITSGNTAARDQNVAIGAGSKAVTHKPSKTSPAKPWFAEWFAKNLLKVIFTAVGFLLCGFIIWWFKLRGVDLQK